MVLQPADCKCWRQSIVFHTLALSVVVCAQTDEDEVREKDDSWSLVLALVIVIVALSLLAICLVVVICEIRTSKPPKPKPSKVELVECGIQADRPETPIQIVLDVRPPSTTVPTTPSPTPEVVIQEPIEFGRLLDEHYRLKTEPKHGRHSRSFQGSAVNAPRDVLIKVFHDSDMCFREHGFYMAMYDERKSGSKREARSYIPDLIDYGRITIAGAEFCALVLECAHFPLENFVIPHKDTSQYVVLSERSAFEQICIAVRYLHRRGFAHGDLNPRSIMFFGNRWKLVDFSNWGNEEGDMLVCVTPHYTAPEIVQAMSKSLTTVPVNQAADAWSLGLIGWEILTKTPLLPVDQYTVEEVERMSFGDIPYPWEGKPAQFWNKIRSPSAIKLIQNCLQRDPDERWDIEKILRYMRF